MNRSCDCTFLYTSTHSKMTPSQSKLKICFKLQLKYCLFKTFQSTVKLFFFNGKITLTTHPREKKMLHPNHCMKESN